ncbi:OOP family OmpA-OmpF porin [Flavobacterium sp. PL11]|jgi:OOP family OmpA-OmpF porin|uniref:OmpA family protein n=1 Tax=Flavobacterium sp. PL11 TaxID=3071717 RepID=UPI002E00F08C|nr:OOP family OmpA-OmpF porin [Flavobacterium sp. PL11]
MKKYTIFIIILFITANGFSQQTVGGKILKNSKDKTYQRGEKKGSEGIDDALDKVEDGIKNIFKKKNKSNTNNKIEEGNNNSQDKELSKGNSSSNTVRKNTKFDFIAGQKLIGLDDFSTTNIGDFPLGWNTNSSAEIVTFDGNDQKWLSITKDGYFQPEFINTMPNNFTIEFEVYTRYSSNNILYYSFYIAPSKNPKKDLSEKYLDNYFKFNWYACSKSAGFMVVEKTETINSNNGLMVNELACGKDANGKGKVSKFSLWRQDGRLRIYVDENKVLDLPQAFDMKQNYTVFKFGAEYMNYSNGREVDDEFMVSNIRYAVAGADTRSKLITEGRLVTNGILFDVNSDNIKPESGSVLKEIGTTLQENPSIRVKIIGHTDNDGDDKTNLSLSQKRAIAIKTALESFYGINASRLETDGKGESQPLNKNANAADKAQNRRVEFVKL